MVFQRLKRKKFDRTLKKAGISRDTRKEASGIFGDKRKIKIGEGESRFSLNKKLKRETGLSYSERQRVIKAHQEMDGHKHPTSSHAPSVPSKSDIHSAKDTIKPKTSPWQGIKDSFKAGPGPGRDDLSNLRKSEDSPGFTRESGKSSRDPGISSDNKSGLNRPSFTSSRGSQPSRPSSSSSRGSSLSREPKRSR